MYVVEIKIPQIQHFRSHQGLSGLLILSLAPLETNQESSVRGMHLPFDPGPD